MATNIIYDRIFKGLKILLGRRAIIMGDDAPKSSDYILLSMESSPELIENTGPTTAMLYSVNIDFVTNRAKKAKYITQQLSNIWNILNNNTAYTAKGVYYWHGAETINSEFGEGEGFASRILWTATHTEQRS